MASAFGLGLSLVETYSKAANIPLKQQEDSHVSVSATACPSIGSVAVVDE